MNHLVQGAGLEALLLPLSPQLPCGPDIDGDRTYGAIRHARRADDPHASLGDWEKAAPPKRSDWRQAEQLCVTALRTESKDLNIAGWLCEAWIHLRGLAGLADGLALIDALVEQYWDEINPLMTDGDIACRTGSFEWLARNLPLALRAVPLAPGATPSGRALTLGEWESVLRAERQLATAAAAQRGRYTPPPPAPGQTLRAHFENAAAEAPADFYPQLQRQVEQGLWTVEQLSATLDARVGQLAPSLAPLAAMLDACGAAAAELGGRALADDPQDEGVDDEVSEMDTRMDSKAEPPVRRGAIDSRVEAYRRLTEVADYLQRTEPHSPVPLLVRRAVAWGEMPLEELLQELLDSESDLKQIYRLLGTRGK